MFSRAWDIIYLKIRIWATSPYHFGSYCISNSLWFISYCIFYQLLYFGRSATFSGNSQHQIFPKLEEEILSPSLIQGHPQLSLIICPLMVPIGDKGKLHWLQLKSDSRDVSHCTLVDQRPPSIRFVQTWRWGGRGEGVWGVEGQQRHLWVDDKADLPSFPLFSSSLSNLFCAWWKYFSLDR